MHGKADSTKTFVGLYVVNNKVENKYYDGKAISAILFCPSMCDGSSRDDEVNVMISCWHSVGTLYGVGSLGI